jgi:hypothetical protein
VIEVVDEAHADIVAQEPSTIQETADEEPEQFQVNQV